MPEQYPQSSEDDKDSLVQLFWEEEDAKAKNEPEQEFKDPNQIK